jgi:hypothetical protein
MAGLVGRAEDRAARPGRPGGPAALRHLSLSDALFNFARPKLIIGDPLRGLQPDAARVMA